MLRAILIFAAAAHGLRLQPPLLHAQEPGKLYRSRRKRQFRDESLLPIERAGHESVRSLSDNDADEELVNTYLEKFFDDRHGVYRLRRRNFLNDEQKKELHPDNAELELSSSEEIWDDEVVEPVLTFDTHRRTSAGARESRNKFLTIAGRKVKSYDDMHELDREDVSERDFGNRLTCVPSFIMYNNPRIKSTFILTMFEYLFRLTKQCCGCAPHPAHIAIIFLFLYAIFTPIFVGFIHKDIHSADGKSQFDLGHCPINEFNGSDTLNFGLPPGSPGYI
jgi:hypothetical protein